MTSLTPFLQSHPNLRFLGLLLTNVCKDDYFRELPHSHLAVAGNGSEQQIVEALRRYQGRAQFTQNALYHLFKVTARLKVPRVDLIRVR